MKSILIGDLIKDSKKHCVLFFSAVLSSVKLWYDCILCTDDLERSHGSHWQRESYSCCSEVCISISAFYILRVLCYCEFQFMIFVKMLDCNNAIPNICHLKKKKKMLRNMSGVVNVANTFSIKVVVNHYQ